jgi:hypothetical protein
MGRRSGTQDLGAKAVAELKLVLGILQKIFMFTR